MCKIFWILIVLGQEWIFIKGLRSINLAKGRPTSSSTRSPSSSRAVDGDTNPDFYDGLSCWETGTNDMNPYWMVDLGSEYDISVVVVTNRGDCCWTRLHDFEIEVYSENPEEVTGAQSSHCNMYFGAVGDGATETIRCSEPSTRGRYVKINGLERVNDMDKFTLCEVQIYSFLGPCFDCSLVRQEKMRNDGSVLAMPESSQSDCNSACYHNATCIGFNYNPRTLVCEMVSVSGTLMISVDWNYFSLGLCQGD